MLSNLQEWFHYEKKEDGTLNQSSQCYLICKSGFTLENLFNYKL